MRLNKHKHSTTMLMNMTPMIDIVFLLLIFFMTVSQISEVNKEKLELPKHEGTEDQQPTTVIVNVDQDGRIIVSGKDYSPGELSALIGDELASKGGEPSRVTVMLRADRRGTCRTVNEVIRMLDALKITRVNIGVHAQS